MEIIWRPIEDKDEKIINSWLDNDAKKMLCMENVSWQQTASDIGECLSIMNNAQFRNAIGYVDGEPVCALMFGVEFSGKILRLYNILVAPKHRNKGVAKSAMEDILSNENKFKLNKTYDKIVFSILPENKISEKLAKTFNFKFDGQNDIYLDFSCDLNKEWTK